MVGLLAVHRGVIGLQECIYHTRRDVGGPGSTPPSAYAGSWVGTWQPDGPDEITVYLTISNNGSVTGDSYDFSQNLAIYFKGTISRTGAANFTISEPGAGYPAIKATGNLAIQGSGHLTGWLTTEADVDIYFDLVRQ